MGIRRNEKHQGCSAAPHLLMHGEDLLRGLIFARNNDKFMWVGHFSLLNLMHLSFLCSGRACIGARPCCRLQPRSSGLGPSPAFALDHTNSCLPYGGSWVQSFGEPGGRNKQFLVFVKATIDGAVLPSFHSGRHRQIAFSEDAGRPRLRDGHSVGRDPTLATPHRRNAGESVSVEYVVNCGGFIG